MLADCHAMLAKIPTVRHLWAGRPSDRSTPKFGAKDYDVGLLILFDDADGLAAYDRHQLHQDFVQKHLKHLEKVQVFDFMNQKK